MDAYFRQLQRQVFVQTSMLIETLVVESDNAHMLPRWLAQSVNNSCQMVDLSFGEGRWEENSSISSSSSSSFEKDDDDQCPRIPHRHQRRPGDESTNSGLHPFARTMSSERHRGKSLPLLAPNRRESVDFLDCDCRDILDDDQLATTKI